MSEEVAPVIDKTKTATLTNLVSKTKEKAKKIPNKNVLCQEMHKWPRPSKEVGENILSSLSQALTSSDVFKDLSGKDATDEAKARKAETRTQLAIGVSSVFRALEKDALSCVLISGQARPAITVEHVIALARDRCCPLLCLDQLAPTVAKATDSKCLPLALGFKRVESDTESVFHSVVLMVTQHAEVRTSLQVPVVSTNDESLIDTENVQIKKNALRPLQITKDGGRKILDELHRVLLKAQAPQKPPERKKKKKKKKKTKKNLKDVVVKTCSHQFEIGKRTVQDILGQGKIEMVLVSDSVQDILVTEAATRGTSTSCLLQLAAKRNCPVVCVPGLTDRLRPVFMGSVAVVGIKKLFSVPAGTEQYFDKLIQMVTDVIKTDVIFDIRSSAESKSTATNHQSKDSAAQADKDSTKEEEEDYSYLYVMKADSKELQERIQKRKAETEQREKQMTFSSDFISLGGDGDTKFTAKKSVSETQNVVKKRKFIERRLGKDANSTSVLFPSTNLFSVDRTPSALKGVVGETVIGRDSVQPVFSVDRTGGQVVSKAGGQTNEAGGHGDVDSASSPQSDVTNDQSDPMTDNGIKDSIHSVSENKEENSKILDSNSAQQTCLPFVMDRRSQKQSVVVSDEKDNINIPSLGDSYTVQQSTVTELQAVQETAGILQTDEAMNSTEGSSNASQLLFAIDRSASNKKALVESSSKQLASSSSPAPFQVERHGGASTSKLSSTKPSTSWALGDTGSTKPESGVNVLAMHQPATKGKGKKRKAESEGFISFAYTEANIHTMVANVSKKKKKKKKK